MKELVVDKATEQEVMKKITIVSNENQVDEEQLRSIYEKMMLFYKEIEDIGGLEKYQLSNISWLKTELELLIECSRFCNDEGMKLTDIFYQISNEQKNILPKTSSQITHIYYQIKKHHQPIERIIRKKAGRKRKSTENTDPTAEKKHTKEVKVIESHAYQGEYSEKGFMKLLSGTMNNLAIIYQNQEKNNTGLYHLIEEFYKLSLIGGENSGRMKEYEKTKKETEILQAQLEYILCEKENMIQDFRKLVDCVQKFIDSPEMTQIITLPIFISDSKKALEKLKPMKPAKNEEAG